MTITPRKLMMQKSMETISIKGIPKLLKSKTYFQKGIWAMSVIVGLSVCLYQVVPLISGYLNYQITIANKEVPYRVQFPDVTICNLNPDAIHVDLPDVDSYDDYVLLIYSQDDMNISTIESTLLSTTGYLQYIRPDVKNLDYLKRNFAIDSKFELWPSSPIGKYVENQDLMKNYISLNYNPLYGPCLTYKSSSLENDIQAFVAIFYLADNVITYNEAGSKFHLDSTTAYTSGLKIYLHSPDTFPVLEGAFDLLAGSAATVLLDFTKRTRLPMPYGSCTDTINIPFRYFKKYKYTPLSCISACTQVAIIEKCNCLSNEFISTEEMQKEFYFCGMYNKSSVSAIKNKIRCQVDVTRSKVDCSQCQIACQENLYGPKIQTISWPHEKYHPAFYKTYIEDNDALTDNKVFDFYKTTLFNDNSTKTIMEKLVESNLIKRNFAQVTVKFTTPLAHILEDQPALRIETLVGTLGGILNLWIGFTFVTIIEVIEMIYHIMCPPKYKTDNVSNVK